jgi:penicillin-binding protein 1B
VYLTAFGKRDLPKPITPASIFVDSPIALVWGKGEDETWSPKNYDGEYRGTMTARQALEQSINIPTVRIAVTETAPGRTLLPDIVETARRAGISSPLRPYPSLALGSFETSPMEVAAAYCTFANGGFRVKPNALLGLVTPSLRRMESRDEPIVRGADADAVSVLDSVLRGVVDHGTGGSARRLGAQGIFAGKTGTTNDGRDAWFVGFSPRFLAAVWVGYDDNRGLSLSGSQAAVPIFADFVRSVPAQLFAENFPVPSDVVTAEIDPDTGYLASAGCLRRMTEVFIEGTAPTQICPLHAR